MCYSNCPNENNMGECCRSINKLDNSLHCFEGFECKGCIKIFSEDENFNGSDFCEDCFIENLVTECNQCNEYHIEVVDGICDKCFTINEKKTA